MCRSNRIARKKTESLRFAGKNGERFLEFAFIRSSKNIVKIEKKEKTV